MCLSGLTRPLQTVCPISEQSEVAMRQRSIYDKLTRCKCRVNVCRHRHVLNTFVEGVKSACFGLSWRLFFCYDHGFGWHLGEYFSGLAIFQSPTSCFFPSGWKQPLSHSIPPWDSLSMFLGWFAFLVCGCDAIPATLSEQSCLCPCHRTCKSLSQLNWERPTKTNPKCASTASKNGMVVVSRRSRGSVVISIAPKIQDIVLFLMFLCTKRFSTCNFSKLPLCLQIKGGLGNHFRTARTCSQGIVFIMFFRRVGGPLRILLADVWEFSL